MYITSQKTVPYILFLGIRWILEKFKHVIFLHPANNDNLIMICSEWLDLNTSLSPKPEPQDCLCSTGAWQQEHGDSTTSSFFWSFTAGGALFWQQKCYPGDASRHQPCSGQDEAASQPCSGSATVAQGAKWGCSPRAVQRAGDTSCSDLPCCPLGLLALGKDRTQQDGAGKGREGANALHQLWSHKFPKQMSGEFPALPQLCWEHKYFSFVPVPNQLQHPAAVLVCFDWRDTTWCQHKVTRYQYIHPNSHLGCSKIITIILSYMFKALQPINMHRLIYSPDSASGTGKVSDIIKLQAEWQGHITSPDGTVC